MVNLSGSALRIPYVLFDLGGTLIFFKGNFSEVIEEAIMRAAHSLRSAGYDLDAQVFAPAYRILIDEYYEKRNNQFVEFTSEYVLREALRAHGYAEPLEAHMQQALKDMYAYLQTHWHTEADAASTLEELLARGYRLGIVSNASDDADVRVLVENSGLRNYFDFILTSAVAGFRKPSKRIFEQALAFWNAQAEQAVMVGDTVSADIRGAKQAGIGSIWITRRAETVNNQAALQHWKPDAIISTLSELPALLETWP
jgi:putative hydrolase of the HAD superfamily